MQSFIAKPSLDQKLQRGGKENLPHPLSGVDNDWKCLIRLTIYGFYCETIMPTLASLYAKLIQISKGTNYEFRYKHTSLYHLVRKLGFKYNKYDKRSVIMESVKIVVWSYKYLLEIANYKAQNYLIVY